MLKVVGRRAATAVLLLAVVAGLGYAVDPGGHGFPTWLGLLVTGRLGPATGPGRPAELFAHAAAATAVLVAVAAVVSAPVVLVAGIGSAWRRGRAGDALATTGALVLGAVPAAVAGALLVLGLAVALPWFPAVAAVTTGLPLHRQAPAYVLPVATLVLVAGLPAIRAVRAVVVAVLDQPYVRQARLAGVPERDLLVRHVLPHAARPLLAIGGRLLVRLAGAALVVECVFGYAGLGRGLADAVARGDLAAVQAQAVLVTAALVVVRLLADVAGVLVGGRYAPPARTAADVPARTPVAEGR